MVVNSDPGTVQSVDHFIVSHEPKSQPLDLQKFCDQSNMPLRIRICQNAATLNQIQNLKHMVCANIEPPTLL